MRPNSSSSRAQGSITSTFTNSGRPQSVTSGINAVPTNHGRVSSKFLPYALLDFDKLQVFVNAVSGSPENPLWAGNHTSYKFDVSRATELSIQIYLRNPNAKPGSGRSEDILIGACRVNPRFEEPRPFVEDPKSSKKDKERAAAAYAEQERSMGQMGAEWLNMSHGTGQLKVGVEYVENRQKALKIEDFELLKVVGKGSFGKVMQVMYVATSRIRFYLLTQAGNVIHIVYMLSRPFEKHTSSRAPRLHIPWQNGLSLLRSTIPLLFLSSSLFSHLKSSTSSLHLSMEGNCSITCRKNNVSTSIGHGFTLRNFYARSSVFTDSMSFIET